MSRVSKRDTIYMARAIQMARRGLYTTDPNPRVGCVIVSGDRVVGEGWHRRAGDRHAEAEALSIAGERARGADVYVTLEPCCHHGRTPPCTEALIQAHVGRVIAAMPDPNPQVAGRGLQMLEDTGIATSSGLLAAESAALNPGFCRRMQTGMPFVVGKIAMSLDGRTALASGESQWISGDSARLDAHRLRARSSAILTGIGTVLADDPAFTARLGEAEGDIHQPVKVIVDSFLRIPADAKLAKLSGRSIVLTSTPDKLKCEQLIDSGFEVEVLPADDEGRVNLRAAIEFLGAREMNEVMVEAGPTLNGALLQAGLIDELIVYTAPCLLGDDARGLFHFPPLKAMSDRFKLKMLDTRRFGQDLRIRLKVIGDTAGMQVN